VSFHVIMACHNRCELTVQAVRLAQASADRANAVVSFTVFDDGSSDGTAEQLLQLPSAVTILSGDGSAFWASGMAQAEARVLEQASVVTGDFLVWLNDDVMLDVQAFPSILGAVERAESGSVLVGAMRDIDSGEVTYSGLRRAGPHPLSFTIVPPDARAVPVEAFNGNLVVVPVEVAGTLGGIDGGFSHALADIDYGLRAGRFGIPVLLIPHTLGTCSRNMPIPRSDVKSDWRTFTGPKGGGNFVSLRRILRKSNPNSWLLVVLTSYLLWWARRLLTCLPDIRLQAGRSRICGLIARRRNDEA